MDDIDAVVCARIDDPTAIVVPGSRVRACAQCGTQVWVARSSFATFKGKKMPLIWCVECALLAAQIDALKRGKRPPGRA